MAPDTGRMTSVIAQTALVSGADGFIGRALVRVLARRGHRVFALAGTAAAVERVRSIGAVPVLGDLSNPGPWQDEAGADWVFHVVAYPERGKYPGQTRVGSIMRRRLATDALLLDTLAATATQRIVYVGDACCYGPTGDRPITEDVPPRPSAAGRCLGPALDRLDGYIIAGLPIVTALPGLVYGDGSWFRQRVIDPMTTGRRVIRFGRADHWVSPIHVEDCARALVHLAAHGHVGSRYFVVNSTPVRIRGLRHRLCAPHEPAASRVASAGRRSAIGHRSDARRLPDARSPLLEHPAQSDGVRIQSSDARRRRAPDRRGARCVSRSDHRRRRFPTPVSRRW